MQTKNIEIINITVSGNNARTNFPEDEHKELMDSIRRVGLINRIIVAESKEGKYELIAGERRLRAYKELFAKYEGDYSTIPCTVLPSGSEAKAAFIRLDENRVRLNLSAVEEAREFEVLCKTFSDMKQGEVAKMADLHASKASKRLSLLKLPKTTQEYNVQGNLDESTAYEIYRLRDTLSDKEIDKFATDVVSKGLGRREVEARVNKLLEGKKEKTQKSEVHKDAQNKLMSLFVGRKAKVSDGKITLGFDGDEDLKALMVQLERGVEPVEGQEDAESVFSTLPGDTITPSEVAHKEVEDTDEEEETPAIISVQDSTGQYLSEADEATVIGAVWQRQAKYRGHRDNSDDTVTSIYVYAGKAYTIIHDVGLELPRDTEEDEEKEQEEPLSLYQQVYNKWYSHHQQIFDSHILIDTPDSVEIAARKKYAETLAGLGVLRATEGKKALSAEESYELMEAIKREYATVDPSKKFRRGKDSTMIAYYIWDAKEYRVTYVDSVKDAAPAETDTQGIEPNPAYVTYKLITKVTCSCDDADDVELSSEELTAILESDKGKKAVMTLEELEDDVVCRRYEVGGKRYYVDYERPAEIETVEEEYDFEKELAKHEAGVEYATEEEEELHKGRTQAHKHEEELIRAADRGNVAV